MKKVIRDGKVGVILSNSNVNGWWTMNMNSPECLHSPKMIEIIEAGKLDSVSTDYCRILFHNKSFNTLALKDLYVKWLPVDIPFAVVITSEGKEAVIIDSNEY